MELHDRVAVVTGGGFGIGRGIALELARQGARIVVADIDSENAGKVAAEVQGLGRNSLYVEADVTSQESTDALVESALEHFGVVDILVNNAGVGGAEDWHKDLTADAEDWDASFSVNVFGIVHCIRSVEEHMKSRRYGKIVNIASVAGRTGQGIAPQFAASKAAAINVSQAYAVRLAPSNINVNTICPGLLWTGFREKAAKLRKSTRPDEKALSEYDVFLRRVAETIPLNREQTPEDIGKAAAFLVSERARNITGQAINVSGGWINN